MTAQINGLNQAARNANDGISLAQVAEGALGSVTGNLQRMRELAVQSANATNSASDRAALQQEVAQLTAEIDRVATQTQFNGLNLLDGSFTAQQFQVGANAGQTITVSSIASARASALGVYQGFNLVSQSIGTASNTAQALTVNGRRRADRARHDRHRRQGAGRGDHQRQRPRPGGERQRDQRRRRAHRRRRPPAPAPRPTPSTASRSRSPASTRPALASNRANAVAAINAQSAATGVVATDTGSGVTLSAADGRNISIAYAQNGFTGSAAADFGLSAAPITGGTLNLSYSAPSGVSGSVVFAQAGGLNSSTAIAGTGTSVSAMDISTVAGSNAALTSIDAALQTINSSRAALGAVQNRFSSTIENLQTAEREPVGLAQPHPGRRLRRGNREPVARPGAAAGRHGDDRAGQPAAAAGAAAPEGLSEAPTTRRTLHKHTGWRSSPAPRHR